MKGSDIALANISKQFGDFNVLNNISLTIKKGEFFSLLGPSGCGKTTALRIIAGFEEPSAGTVFLDSADVTKVPSNKRHVNTVFQSYALFPHLSIFENVAFPLRLKKVPSSIIKNKVSEYLELVRLLGHEKKMPAQLSGGQKQRVAIARALINEPSVLLLDEPLSALDAKLRQHMLIELDAIHDKIGITFVYVTHDQQEALSVSDRVAVMNEGKILQIGTPQEIYEHPQSSFVATFIGETNMVSGVITEVTTDAIIARVADLGVVVCKKDRNVNVGTTVHITIRPEKIRASTLKPSENSLLNVVSGVVDELIYSGFQTKLFVKISSLPNFLVFQQQLDTTLSGGAIAWKDKVYLSWSAIDCTIVEVASQ